MLRITTELMCFLHFLFLIYERPFISPSIPLSCPSPILNHVFLVNRIPDVETDKKRTTKDLKRHKRRPSWNVDKLGWGFYSTFLFSKTRPCLQDDLRMTGCGHTSGWLPTNSRKVLWRILSSSMLCATPWYSVMQLDCVKCACVDAIG